MKTVSTYKPSCQEVTQARVLLLGPIGSGKSSFVSSVQSVFNGRVSNRAMVGSYTTSFTKKVRVGPHRGSGGGGGGVHIIKAYVEVSPLVSIVAAVLQHSGPGGEGPHWAGAV